MMSQGLILEGVHFGYDGAPILDNIHLHVPPGQFVSLLGPAARANPPCCAWPPACWSRRAVRLYWPAGR